ncbi:carboxypeptidase-like regulatory domain-containing protein [Anaerosporobacter sp.]|uniref:carboxypeptidase-like regulatory domain-containing protein n=1 Tax=Anaerosporobacter sp. TaxID=1872529 RepID=UPI00286EE78A|nr:carboxypeptidase regulatory-like domain-containing protein [Anaerosporobacter sp.]
MRNYVYPAQTQTQSLGKLLVRVNSEANLRPIEDATIQITRTGDPTSIIEEIRTNSIGQTETIELPAPPLDYSLEPDSSMPYSEYTLQISAPGFEDMTVSGSQILPTVTAVQESQLLPITADPTSSELFVISPHTLYYEYPPKIAEPEIKDVSNFDIVLDQVVVPEYVVVHDGPPTDNSAKNHYVLYRDYIKNVASSEIYATWPEATIQANVLAIMSFTLNRVYTEWYRNKGYSFTITSSTAFDHKWIAERNIFENISLVVDSIFNNFLSRPNVRQPILTQYCDGVRVQCPNWMT